MEAGPFESVCVMKEHCEIVLSVAYVLMTPQGFKVPNLIEIHTFQKLRISIESLDDVNELVYIK